MKTPEELFNKAKNIKEPLNATDAEKMILGAKATGNVAKPPSNKKAILLGILGTLSVIAVIAAWLYNSPSNELENSTFKNTDSLKNNSYTTNKPLAKEQQTNTKQKALKLADKKQQNTQQKPLSTTVDKGTATTKKDKPQNKKPIQSTNNKPTNTPPKNTKKGTDKSTSKTKKDNPKQDDVPVFLDTTVNPTTPKQQPPFVLLDSGAIKKATDNTKDSSKKAIASTADTAATTNNDSAEAVAKLLQDDTEPTAKEDSTKKPFKRWYVKTDLLGYMYNNVLKKTMFYTNSFPAEFGITGNKYSLGIEYRFTKRLSLGLSANYGFINNLIEGDYVTVTNNTYSFSETLSTFKGLVVSIEPRYYYLAKKHSSAFVAPFFSYGSMKHGVFFSGTRRGATTPEYFTLAQTEGYSYGAGLLTGYKFEYKHFFVEPLLGIVVAGADRNYQQVQEQSTVYWNNLLRVELSAGITF